MGHILFVCVCVLLLDWLAGLGWAGWFPWAVGLAGMLGAFGLIGMLGQIGLAGNIDNMCGVWVACYTRPTQHEAR